MHMAEVQQPLPDSCECGVSHGPLMRKMSLATRHKLFASESIVEFCKLWSGGCATVDHEIRTNTALDVDITRHSVLYCVGYVAQQSRVEADQAHCGISLSLSLWRVPADTGRPHRQSLIV